MKFLKPFLPLSRKTVKIFLAGAVILLLAPGALLSCAPPRGPHESLPSDSGARETVSIFSGRSSDTSDIGSSRKISSGSAPYISRGIPSAPEQTAALVDYSLTARQIREFLDSPELRLVNRENILSEDYVPELLDITKYSSSDGKRRIAAQCFQPLCSLIDAARGAGVKVRVVSGYRSYKTQKNIYDTNISSYVKAGYSRDKAVSLTQRVIMPPGSSEHQYGYAVDIAEKSELNTELEKTAGYQWMFKNAPDYGFILRYPKNKESITGVSYEPWHFRYVGVYHAKIITQNGVCLEEYVGALKLRLSKLN